MDFLSPLPTDIKKLIFYGYLDESSKVVVRSILLSKEIPKRLPSAAHYEIYKYGPRYTEYFLNLGIRLSVDSILVGLCRYNEIDLVEEYLLLSDEKIKPPLNCFIHGVRNRSYQIFEIFYGRNWRRRVRERRLRKIILNLAIWSVKEKDNEALRWILSSTECCNIVTVTMWGHCPVAEAACKYDNLEAVKLLVPYHGSDEYYKNSAAYGQHHILEYLRSAGYHMKYPTSLAREALSTRNINNIKYLVDNGYVTRDRIMTAAAGWGDLPTLKYARSLGCDWDERVCEEVVQRNKLDMLMYLHENGCPWDGRSYGAAMNRLDTVMYLHDNGCPLDKILCETAAAGDRLDILLYAFEIGCPYEVEGIMKMVSRCNSVKVLKYMLDLGAEWKDEYSVNVAHYGSVDVLKIILERGYEWTDDHTRKITIFNREEMIGVLKELYWKC